MTTCPHCGKTFRHAASLGGHTAAVHPRSSTKGLPDDLAPVAPPGPWFFLAACKGTDVHAWFPARGQSLKALRAVCETCPVREDCGTYALDHGIKHGVWGGMSERERRLIRRDRRLENA